MAPLTTWPQMLLAEGMMVPRDREARPLVPPSHPHWSLVVSNMTNMEDDVVPWRYDLLCMGWFSGVGSGALHCTAL